MLKPPPTNHTVLNFLAFLFSLMRLVRSSKKSTLVFTFVYLNVWRKVSLSYLFFQKYALPRSPTLLLNQLPSSNAPIGDTSQESLKRVISAPPCSPRKMWGYFFPSESETCAETVEAEANCNATKASKVFNL